MTYLSFTKLPDLLLSDTLTLPLSRQSGYVSTFLVLQPQVNGSILP